MKPRVLIVDDEPDIVLILKKDLSPAIMMCKLPLTAKSVFKDRLPLIRM